MKEKGKRAVQLVVGGAQAAVGSAAFLVGTCEAVIQEPKNTWIGLGILFFGLANAVGGSFRFGRGTGRDLPTLPEFFVRAFKTEKDDLGIFTEKGFDGKKD